jgi:orotidine-5'-phosphate decarboxylase
MTFTNKLKNIWSKNNSLLCVGLDPDMEKLPKHLLKSKYPVFDFNKAIVDATHDLVCAYKPQIAFYSAHRAEDQLEMTMQYIVDKYPDLIIILDSKRNDIGNTAAMYAVEAFDRYQADALTVSPYLGGDSMTPYFDRKDKGVIILCRTSNAGSGDLQDLEIKGEKLYKVVAKKAVNEWNYNKNISLVVGATYPNELKEIRSLVGDMPLLVPGVGVQGGDVQATVKNGVDKSGTGMMINSSRGIIFSDSGANFDQAARKTALGLRDEINSYR